MIERLERELKSINYKMKVMNYRKGSPDYLRLLCRKCRIDGALAFSRGEVV